MRRYCDHCGMTVEFKVLKGEDYAELRDNSHAELWDNSHAVLWGNSHVQCRSPYACGILKSMTAECIGRHIGDKPLSPKEYLTNCGVEIKNQYVILYKSVRDNFASYHDNAIKYWLEKEVIAPDWKPNDKIECGKGLHLSPTIQQARNFNDGGIYLACRVKLSDIAPLPAYAEYPDKIRVRACTPLYQVDKEGNKLEVKV